MGAVYKKEMRGYLTSLSGAITTAVVLFMAGFVFRLYNLYYAVATFSYALNASAIVYYIVTPVLSMRVFAEERRNRTDQMLLTAPAKLSEIVLGKYFAMITILAIPVAVMCLYPLIIRSLGSTTYQLDYVLLLAFYLMGCAYLSIGMFLSSLTESMLAASIGSVLFVFLTQLISNAYSFIGSSNASGRTFFLILALLAGALVYLMTKHKSAAVGTALVLAAVCLIVYRISPSWFGGKTEAVLSLIDFRERFDTLSNGSLSLPDLAYFVSAALIGIVLTMQSIQKRRWS